MLNIRKKTEDAVLTVALEGKVDSVTSRDFSSSVREDLDQADFLVIDMEGLKYISSAGLRELLSLHKIMSSRGGMKLTHINDTVMNVMDITGFSTIFTIE